MNTPQSHLINSPRNRQGLTLIELMIASSIIALIATSTIAGLTAVYKQGYSLSVYNSTMILVNSELERIRSIPYEVPSATFSSTSNIGNPIVSQKLLKVNKDDSSVEIPIELTTVISPIAEGHYVKVTATYNLGGKNYSQLSETVINQHSGGSF